MQKFMSYLSNRLSTQVLILLWSKLIKIGIHCKLEKESFQMPQVAIRLDYLFRNKNQMKKKRNEIEELKKVASRIWRGITQEYLQELYASMPKRMNAVICLQGGNTKC